MIKIYGIKNCDTVKKTLSWFTSNNVEYEFFDYKKVGADAEILRKFIECFGLDKVLNKRGTTWRKLDPAEQEKVVDIDSAIALMLQHNSLIKRPLIEADDQLFLGFSEKELRGALI